MMIKKRKKPSKLKLKSDKPSRKALEKSLDDLWRKIVKARASQRCEYCLRKGAVLHAHHIFSRSHRGTRWLEDNGVALCAGHHYNAHKDPERFRDWLLLKMPEEKYNILKMKAYTITKFGLSDLIVLEQELKKRLHEELEKSCSKTQVFNKTQVFDKTLAKTRRRKNDKTI